MIIRYFAHFLPSPQLLFSLLYIMLLLLLSLQSCPTLCDPRRQPTRLPRPWDSPGKNTGVGCLFLLQCIKVKSESVVAQSYPTLSDPMDCSLPGSSIHGIFQARVLEWCRVERCPDAQKTRHREGEWDSHWPSAGILQAINLRVQNYRFWEFRSLVTGFKA